MNNNLAKRYKTRALGLLVSTLLLLTSCAQSEAPYTHEDPYSHIASAKATKELIRLNKRLLTTRIKSPEEA